MKKPAAWWRALRTYARAHVFIAAVAILIVLYGGYLAYGAIAAPATATRYITTTVATGTVVATLSETGQVNASRDLALTPKASGQVITLYVQPGQQVYAGQAIAQLDAANALQSLQNAQLSLANAELSYAQTTAPGTLALNLLTARNGVTNAETSLRKTHDSAYASIAAMYTDFLTVMNGIDSVLHDDATIAGHANQKNIDAYADTVSTRDSAIFAYKNSAETAYAAAVTAAADVLAAYKATPRSVSDEELIALAERTYQAAGAIADAVKDAHDFFDRVNADYTFYNLGSSPALAGLISSVNGYTTTMTSNLSEALTAKSNIVSAGQSLAQANNTLATTEGGSNTLTVQQAELSLKQAQQAVANAKDTLANYTVTAPFAGTIASISVDRYDQASSGTTIATLVTNTENVKVSVNEIDAAKLAAGQKATLAFDALPDVTIAGTVTALDVVGAVSQGVVSYTATIALDTNHPNVKPGMSATADIVIGSETGLVVPASAVKTVNGKSFVEVFDPPLSVPTEFFKGAGAGAAAAAAPVRVPVVIGLTNDTDTIITSGIPAGTQVVTRTIAGTGAAASSAAPSTSVFGGTGAGGAVRVLTR